MSPCILFQGSTAVTGGYGQQKYEGKIRRAHRVAYCKAHGLPMSAIDGLVVRHKCDNPPCVNPDHLELGTHQDNVNDMMQRGRHVSPALAREDNGRAVLTEADVRTARALYVKGDKELGVAGLSRRFGVSESAMRFVVKGKTWR